MLQRPAVRKAIDKENDENGVSTRVTRAKAAALEHAPADALKKPMARTKSATSTLTADTTLGSRKRAALGDVSNVAKNEAPLDGKKAGKGGLLSKAAQPTKVTKPSRTTARAPLGSKTKNVPELSRQNSGANISAPEPKKRRLEQPSTTRSIKDEDEASENQEPPKQKSKPSSELKKEFTQPISKPVEAPQLELPEISYELPPGVEDLDADDVFDPLMVSEYVNEIFDYMKELEISTMANHSYMDNQPELEWKMRGILVDWLLEVHTRFRLLPETLFLAVNIIDRFLSCKVVQLDRLQLVGVTAMFIASKYEEVLSPHVQNFRHVADDGFTEEEILQAEKFVLQALDYDLSYPNPMNFLRRISKADNYDVQTRTFGKYLLEISCLDHRFIEYPPSHVSAAAMYLARLVNESGEWVSHCLDPPLYTD